MISQKCFVNHCFCTSRYVCSNAAKIVTLVISLNQFAFFFFVSLVFFKDILLVDFVKSSILFRAKRRSYLPVPILRKTKPRAMLVFAAQTNFLKT